MAVREVNSKAVPLYSSQRLDPDKSKKEEGKGNERCQGG